MTTKSHIITLISCITSNKVSCDSFHHNDHFLLFFYVSEEVIMDSPTNVEADVGVWANFTCSVSCDHLINWFVEGYPSDISTACSSTHNNLMACKQTTHECSPGGARNYSETLRVLAKAKHAGSKIAVQCVAALRMISSRNSCNPFYTFSRFALLSGKKERVGN